MTTQMGSCSMNCSLRDSLILDLTWKGQGEERGIRKKGREKHLDKGTDRVFFAPLLPIITQTLTNLG